MLTDVLPEPQTEKLSSDNCYKNQTLAFRGFHYQRRKSLTSSVGTNVSVSVLLKKRIQNNRADPPALTQSTAELQRKSVGWNGSTFPLLARLAPAQLKRLIQQALAVRYFYCGEDPKGFTAVIFPINHSELNEKARPEFNMAGATFKCSVNSANHGKKWNASGSALRF